MPKLTLLLTVSLLFFPLVTTAQTCNTSGLPATTPTSRYSRYDNGTVVDRHTGLMWKACLEGQAWNPETHSCDLVAARYTWSEALEQAKAANKQSGFASFKNWHLPNVKELTTLIERQCRNPAINLEVFPNAGGGILSTSTLFSGTQELDIDFSNGHDVFRYGAHTSQVRLVREQK